MNQWFFPSNFFILQVFLSTSQSKKQTQLLELLLPSINKVSKNTFGYLDLRTSLFQFSCLLLELLNFLLASPFFLALDFHLPALICSHPTSSFFLPLAFAPLVCLLLLSTLPFSLSLIQPPFPCFRPLISPISSAVVSPPLFAQFRLGSFCIQCLEQSSQIFNS